MDFQPIRTESDHKAALRQISTLMESDPEPGTPDGAFPARHPASNLLSPPRKPARILEMTSGVVLRQPAASLGDQAKKRPREVSGPLSGPRHR